MRDNRFFVLYFDVVSKKKKYETFPFLSILV